MGRRDSQRADERDRFEELCVRAVSIAAMDHHLDPEALAVELAQGEIGLMMAYLDSAAAQLADTELRANIQALLHRLTTWTRRAE